MCSSYTSPVLVDLTATGLATVKVRRIDFDGVTGNEAIQLFELGTGNADGYCIPRIRFNGGVIIPIKGTVYSKATDGNGANASFLDVNLFTFNASETGAYCIFNPASNVTEADYICYVGGNCTGATGGSDSNVLTCPATPVAAAKVGPGGWRGKVGLLGIATENSGGRNVCFAEEVVATPARLDTARNYFARHSGINEGINKPYSCHNFLIVNGQANDSAVHSECSDKAGEIVGLTLASKTIQRNVADDVSNTFDPTIDTSSCSGGLGTSHILTANIIATGGTPITGSLTSLNVVGCTGSGIVYTCTELDSASGNEAEWSFTGLTDNDNICEGSGTYTASNSDHSHDFNVTCTATRTITITTTPSGNGDTSNIVYSGSGAACSSSTPTCVVPADWTGTLTANGTCNGTPATVSGTSSTITSGVTTATITLADCTAPSTIAVPVTSWTGASNPKLLSWSPVSGATGYKIYTCSMGNNSWCPPVTTGNPAPISDPSYTPPTLGNKDSVCVVIKATDGVSDSSESTVSCIRFNNPSTYTYIP